ncbi:Oidioi.mRNA.OKI2018_I69.chr2.g4395.t1.cds [Oikopleura dioica]|uniref:Oidioi.mRNA.OKI2018_I69.chr2.g4395.t1.cds n=1 Tax=Oikopleura dioica TaxID=34765 RepID=A0ABN7T1G7_OIKDI|nr:Oidioi.mRNA.OKI2018_I69.chr2.g4395.t1.cds [Oikopleura dioica]
MEGKPRFRLQNADSGLLFGGYDFGFGDPPHWGLVCQGSSTHPFDQTFADLLCQNLGFDNAEFIGTRDNYPGNATETTNSCDLEYSMSGSDCGDASSLDECKIKNYRIHGGSCIHGKSEVYMSCSSSRSSAIPGSWSEWSKPGYCDNDSVFTQRTRTCMTDQEGALSSCEGHWLEFLPCPGCNNHEVDYDYNEDYYIYSDDENSSSTAVPVYRPKREVDDPCQCSFPTNSYLEIFENNSGSSTYLLSSFLSIALISGVVLFVAKKKKSGKEAIKDEENLEEEKYLVEEKVVDETGNELLSA